MGTEFRSNVVGWLLAVLLLDDISSCQGEPQRSMAMNICRDVK